MKRILPVLGMVLLSTALGSCGLFSSDPDTPPAPASDKSVKSTAKPTAKSAGQTAKTTRKPAPASPVTSGPARQNPDLKLRSDFTKSAGISFSRVPVTDKYIAITFDDGPNPKTTPRLLEILRARNIKATFYVVGSNVDLYPQVVRRTVAEGHEIGNHSYTHKLLSKLSDQGIRSELSRCQDAIVRACGIQPRTLRPPYGGLSPRQREWVHAEYGYPIVLWAVDPLDWKRPGPSVVSSRILAKTSAGSIILVHDIHSQTVDAMPATLDALLQRGYKFVTVSQLLAMKGDPATAQAATQARQP